MAKAGGEGSKVRYAVVGLGHIAQIAVLPAFRHASENSELVAVVSSDEEKIEQVRSLYDIKLSYTYDKYEECLESGSIDAVYIALPNSMHKEYAVRAAKKGIHILCEKPMATDALECHQMIHAAEKNDVKLMIAYRLHFEETNMKVVEAVQSGKIGKPRLFNSSFTMQVTPDNIRTKDDMGGGPIYDIGIYCINAARYVFKDEPIEVIAMSGKSRDIRFAKVPECVSVTMRFADDKLASFIVSFGAEDVSRYEVIGTEGNIVVDPAYDYAKELEYTLTRGKHVEKLFTPKRDQFAPELLHFSRCVLDDLAPRPSGYEGLADLRVIDAVKKACHSGKVTRVEIDEKAPSHPDTDLIHRKPPVEKPQLVHVAPPHQ